jgi:acylphosphatase
MVKHLNIKVHGRVQGVFFRASTKTQAEALGINGFVRNEKDETVYIEAEGEEEALKKFVEWCSHGPKYAIVEKCEVTESDIRNFNNFIILR